jgi:hypothetical protein
MNVVRPTGLFALMTEARNRRLPIGEGERRNICRRTTVTLSRAPELIDVLVQNGPRMTNTNELMIRDSDEVLLFRA